MADDAELRVDPAVMAGFVQALSGAGENLRTRLKELDARVGEMLGGWQGVAGSAYGSAWQQWHRGAAEVQPGLSILAKLVGEAGVGYQGQESASAEALRGVGGG